MGRLTPPAILITMTPPIGTDDNPQVKPVRQLFGTVFTVFLLLFTLRSFLLHLYVAVTIGNTQLRIAHALITVAASFHLFFFVKALLSPEFISGTPNFKTFLAPAANFSIQLLKILIISLSKNFPEEDYSPQNDLLLESLIFLGILLAYGQRDDMKHCCLCFKPWIIPADRIIEKSKEKSTPQYPTVPFTYPGYNNNPTV